jgi:flagellar motor protein MotB
MSRHQDDGFSHSMTDLMAGVAVTFLLLAAIFMVQADALKRDAEKKKIAAEKQATELRTEPAAKRELDDLQTQLKGVLANKNAQVTPDPKDPLLLLVVFESDDWFPSGACVPHREVHDRIRPILADVFSRVCDASYQHIESIILEGHSDRAPLCPGLGGSVRCGAVDSCMGAGDDENAGFRNNVRLSAARAQEVFFVAREGIERADPTGSVTSCLEQKFVISGRGPVQPRDGGDWRTPASSTLSADRRVVLKVRFRQRDIFDAIGDGGAP